jgi:peptidoglycan/LPS O-acetylase OafA/YrhL
MAAGQAANRIAVLDGYRALAIFAVLAFHYTIRWAPPFDPSPHLPAGKIFDGFAPFEYGWLGVEFFFVISGFVILMTLERCRNVGDFVCRRFARLWPPLVVAATLTTVIVYLLGPADWMVSKYDYMTSILLIGPSITSGLLRHLDVSNTDVKWVDGAYWSLCVEIRFYAWAAVFYLAARKAFIKFWLLFQIAVSLAALRIGMGHSLLSIMFFPDYLPYFTLGVCLYEIYSRGASHNLAVAGAVAAACLILCAAAFGAGQYQATDALVCVPANLAMFVLLFLFVIDHPLVGIFKLGPIVAVGQASYSVYLIHQNIGVSIMRKCVEWGVPYLIVLPLTIGVVVAASLLLFRYVEVPAKSWILRRAQNLIVGVQRHMPWLSYISTPRTLWPT